MRQPAAYLSYMPKTKQVSIAARLAAFDWAEAGRALDACGYTRLDSVLTPQECARDCRLV